MSELQSGDRIPAEALSGLARAGRVRARGARAKGATYDIPDQCARAGLPVPVAEFRFHPKRRWRFDFAFPSQMVALEVEGGVWSHGRHTRGSGYVKDLEKYNAAAALGWQVLRVTPQQVRSGAVIDILRESRRLVLDAYR